MTRLSVNINKIATIRNSRGGNNPDLIQVAKDCERFGAQGITVHPRPDERHIRYNDVFELKKIVTTEFNIEGNCQEQKFIDLVLANKPEQVTLVPDVLGQITSNHGWDTIKNQTYLKDMIRVFKDAGIRVSIFVDPLVEMVEAAATTGTDRIELYMNTPIKFLLFALSLCSFTLVHAQQNFLNITNYRVYYGWAHNYPQDWIVLRKFENQGKEYFMLVNPQTLQTKVNESSFYAVKPMNLAETRTFFKNTPYEKAISKVEKQSISIQDAGIERGLPTETGISLTVDLCPSHLSMDRRIFTTMITEFQKVERPAPIAISLSGLWMLKHKEDLEWLKKLRNEGAIRIIWVNHSYNHRVSKTAPLKMNFLLEPGTDINYEVLATEQLMLKNGLAPSIFFRFPGLVSDQQLVYKITDYGLIPIGSDAWLAKGQQPQAGSIVLIHGNGNEPVGVADFIKLLQSKTKQIANKQWLLYDLRETVDEDAENSD